MKKLLLILLCLPIIILAQQTYVPDDNFEAYLEANGMGNGVPYDDYVTTANINTVTFLDVSNASINNLTGIEDFTSLTTLYCNDNFLTSLDLSNLSLLTDLRCYGNQLTSLDLSFNDDINVVNCDNNQITNLNLSQITTLTYLNCDNNQLTSLDVSNNAALNQLICNNNQLTNLVVSNGNNSNFIGFSATSNPSLTCIEVDDVAWSTTNWLNIDSQHYFSTNCPPPSAIQEHTINKELLKVTDLLGRETKQTNQPLFYIYDDGTVEKRIVIE